MDYIDVNWVGFKNLSYHLWFLWYAAVAPLFLEEKGGKSGGKGDVCHGGYEVTVVLEA